jgi:hypothetical protein|tara:strand:+ start:686 stop:1207 length:522 start_codon:yes stop_codon:yes gene_type:complete
MEIDNKTAKKVIIKSIARTRKDANNLTRPSATHHQDFSKNADKLIKSSTAKIRLLNNVKRRGLTPPSAKLVNKVLNRNADRLMQNPKNIKVLGKTQDRLIRSTGIKDSFKVTEKAWDLNTKSINKRFLKETVKQTMGNIKKLSPAGLVGAIMQPKSVGDATLKKYKNEYKKVK